eukprot:Skav222718  [mRNA]  locus=scaffold4971:19523:19810:+ [translate_table: standard]
MLRSRVSKETPAPQSLHNTVGRRQFAPVVLENCEAPSFVLLKELGEFGAGAGMTIKLDDSIQNLDGIVHVLGIPIRHSTMTVEVLNCWPDKLVVS